MFYYACMLLLAGTVAALLGLGGVAAVAVELAAILFVVDMVIDLATGRRYETP